MARDVSWRTPKRRLFSTPIPEETRTYKPVSHGELANATLRAISDAGFELDVEEYYSAKEGLVATARYTIKDIRDEDMQLEIGWQNSYDKTLSLKFAIGTRIMICENGCVSGNFGSFAKKHMADVQTFAPEEMRNAILEASKVFDIMREDKEIMKQHIIGKERQFELAGKLFFINPAVGSTQLNIINSELKSPSHDYKAPGSIWELYQYVSFSMKDLHPRLWMEAHIDMHKFFLEEVNKNTERLLLESDAEKWRKTIEIEVETERDVLSKKDSNQLDLLEVLEEIEENNLKEKQNE